MQRRGSTVGGVALTALLATSTWAQSGAGAATVLEAQDGERSATAGFELELGRSPTRAGFALDITGGLPHGWALLTLQRDGAPALRSTVPLDAQGDARLVQRNWDEAGGLKATCTLPTAAGGLVELGLTIPPAPQMLQTSAPAATPGQLVITEVMKDPSFVSDSAGEWFEVFNLANHAVNLEGWTIADAGSNQHVLHDPNGVWVGARSYFVLGINADPQLNGGVPVGYKYSNFSLGNGADEIRLIDPNGTLIDVIAYDDGIFWPDEAGKSLNLDRNLTDATANDDGTNWCAALRPFSPSNTDFATPRVANTVCP